MILMPSDLSYIFFFWKIQLKKRPDRPPEAPAVLSQHSSFLSQAQLFLIPGTALTYPGTALSYLKHSSLLSQAQLFLIPAQLSLIPAQLFLIPAQLRTAQKIKANKTDKKIIFIVWIMTKLVLQISQTAIKNDIF